MIFTAPLGLLALLGIPVIVAIHLLRRRFPPRTVAGLFLWHTVQPETRGAARVTRLPITVSLLLECLAALALALIAAGARWQPDNASNHLVVLLDDSASMNAVNARREGARDRAVRRVLAEVQRLGSGGRVTLVQSGERPAVLLGPAALAVEVRPALEKWKPQSPHHSIALSLRLARELAGATGRLMVVSDVSPAARGAGELERGVWLSVGEPLANVGIVSAQRTLSPGDGKAAVLLTLGNFSDSTAHRHLRVSAGEVNVVERDVDIVSGVSSLSVPLSPGLPPVRVTFSGDALQRDNEVILVEPRPQVVGFDNRLPAGRGKQALKRALDSLSEVTQAEHPHIVFEAAENLDKPAEPGAWRVAFGRPPAGLLASGEAKDFVRPFIPEKRNSLLQGVTLAGVVWSGAYPVASSKVYPLVSAGAQPLIVLLGPRPDDGMLFNLDLERTNLVRAPDWPILISNVVEMRRQSLPGPERWNYRIGEWIRIRLGRDPKGPLRFRCGEVERALPPGRLLEFIAPSAGGLLQVTEGDQTIFELGVNFLDEDESNLRNKSSAETGKFSLEAGGLRVETGPATDPLFWVLVAVAAISILVNWCLPKEIPVARL
jgi:von Willebrand factor type A domain/Aerotolerance regulator N-terminal